MKCPACGYDLIAGAAYCPRCGSPVDGAVESTDYLYDAFISYRHLPTDRAAAVKLQKAIEGYRIPKQLQEAAGRARLGKCFRDEDELPTSASLSEQIEFALKRSRYLVVVCTPQTRESLWVMREVETFASYHGRNRILIALAAGEPDESFPPLMLSQLRQSTDGSMVEVPAEPLAADLRDLSNKKFNVEKLRIISTLIGCSFDDLRQRARMRRNRIIATVSAAITAVSTAFGGFSTYQQHRIEQSYHQIQLQQSEFLATESADLLASGDRYQAVQVALAALPLSSVSPDRPYVPAAQLALEQSVGIYPGETVWRPLYSQTDLSDRGMDDGVAYREDGLEALVAADRFVEIRRIQTDELICRFNAEEQLGVTFWSSTVYMGMEFAGDNLVVVYKGVVACFSVADGAMLWSLPVEDVSYDDCSLAVSPDTKTAAVISGTGFLADSKTTVSLIDVHTGAIVKTVTLPGFKDAGRETISFYEDPVLEFSPDGKHLAVGIWGTLYYIDLAKGTYDTRPLHFDCVQAISFVDGYVAAVSWDSAGTYTSMPACLEVFDEGLTRLWEHSAVKEVGYETTMGAQYYNAYGVFGTWSYYGGDDVQLVALFGDELLLLDAKTGKEELCIPSSSSYLACMVVEARGRERIFATMGDGTVICRRPLESNSGKGGTVSDCRLFNDYLRYGDLYEVDGRIYCAAWSEILEKRVVYRFADNGDMIESRLFGETGEYELKSIIWNGPGVCLRTADSIVFIDSTMLEPAITLPINNPAMPLLDIEQTLYLDVKMDSAGDAYLVGKMRQDSGASSGEMVIYRISHEDGSITGTVTTRPGTTLVQCSAANTVDGEPMLVLVQSEFGCDYVDLVTPEGELLHSVELSNIKSVWYAAGKLIVCLDNDVDTTAAFSLVDIETGEAVECDLAGYTLGNAASYPYCTSLSKDGMLFACVCSDGALRMFEAVTGKMLWETRETPPIIQNLLIGADGNVFVQDSFGRCVLVSGLTGGVLKASSTTVPPIVSAMFVEEGNEVMAYFRIPGMRNIIGLTVISLDAETFGPLCIMYNTYYITSGPDSLFLYEDTFTEKYLVARRLSMDELIAYGNELVEGHELTDAERHLYQLGEDATPAGLLSQIAPDVR